jgi:hypothetical protein
MTRRQKGRPARVRPRLEVLEPRDVPTIFTVTTLADAGAGSLREAIGLANTAAGPDDIVFDPSLLGGTIDLASSLPKITEALTITGPGATAAGLTVTGRGIAGVRPFEIAPLPPRNSVTLADLTVTGGNAPDDGGGILNKGVLTLTDVVVTGNTAPASGGGVANETGFLTATGCTIAGNTASIGGGVLNDGVSTATLTGCTVSSNTAESGTVLGGGILNQGVMTVTDSSVTSNKAVGFPPGGNVTGGGVFSGGTLTMVGSTVAGNLSSGSGGGVSSNGTLALSNCTVANNTSFGSGGGILATSAGLSVANLTLNDCTITGNTASVSVFSAGGIFFAGGTFLLNNTVVARNFGGPPDILTTMGVGGVNNFVGIGNGLFGIDDGVAGNHVGTAAAPLDPRLAPLQDNGGPTPTEAPLPGSPLIEAGSNAAIPGGVTTDQRGFLRIVGPAHPVLGGAVVDIGAVEFQPLQVSVTLTSSADPAAAGSAVTFTAAVGPRAFGGSNTPTGSVAFVVDGTTAATVPLAGGSATFTTSTLAPGSHTVRADYLGDALFGPGSATLTPDQQVNQPTGVRAGVPDFAAGPDGGLGPTVRFFNPDATEKFNLTPFDAAFTGGVRIAAADFNGDGVPDLAVGTGPGAATSVRVFDGATKAELFSVAPFEPSFTAGVFVAAGDLDGDGKAELVISPDEGGGPRVRVFHGGDFAQVADFFGIDDPNFRGGARAAVGDVSGDGKGDLVVAAGFGGGPRLAVFDGKSIGGTPVKLFGDFFVFEQTLRNGVFVASGDLDGDGFADVIAGGGPGGGPRVFALSGKDLMAGKQTVLANFFAGDVNNRGGIRVTVKDLDGDNKADLVVGSGTADGSRVTGYLGKSIAADGTPPEQFGFDAFPGFSGGVFVG